MKVNKQEFNNRGLVSVLMPVYNVEKYIEESVNSILNQTYRDLELIIVDDGSTDNTFSILKELEKIDSRINLVKNGCNKKIAESLNVALSLSKGDYIMRMDGDDISRLDRLEIMLKYLSENTEIHLVGSEMIIIDEKGCSIGYRSLIHGFDNLLKILKFSSPVPHIWLCKREVYNIVGPYRLPGVEDYDFLLRMITCGLKFDNIIMPLYYVRVRGGNTSTTIGYRQFVSSKIAYKLYLERKRYGHEVGTPAFKENKGKEDIYSTGLNYLRISIVHFHGKKYYSFLKYLFVSLLISPKVVLKVLVDRVIYSIYFKVLNK